MASTEKPTKKFYFPLITTILSLFMIWGAIVEISIVPDQEKYFLVASTRYLAVLNQLGYAPPAEAAYGHALAAWWHFRDTIPLEASFRDRMLKGQVKVKLEDFESVKKLFFDEAGHSYLRRFTFRSDDTPWYSMFTYSIFHADIFFFCQAIIFFLWINLLHESGWGTVKTLALWFGGTFAGAIGLMAVNATITWFAIGAGAAIGASVGAYFVALLSKRTPANWKRWYHWLPGPLWLGSWILMMRSDASSPTSAMILPFAGLLFGIIAGAVPLPRVKPSSSAAHKELSEADQEVIIALKYLRDHNISLAERHLKRALYADPRHIEAHRHYVSVHLENKKPEKAIPYFEMVLEHDLAKQQVDLALELYKKLLVELPDAVINHNLLWKLGLLAERRTRFQDAAEIYLHMWRLNPGKGNSAKLLLQAGILYASKIHDNAKAKEIFNRLKQESPDLYAQENIEARIATL